MTKCIQDMSWTYDPRCRPWYLTARANFNSVDMTIFESLGGGSMFVSLVNVIKDYENPEQIIGVSAMDLDLTPMTDKLKPLTSISNIEELYLVNRAK